MQGRAHEGRPGDRQHRRAPAAGGRITGLTHREQDPVVDAERPSADPARDHGRRRPATIRALGEGHDDYAGVDVRGRREISVELRPVRATLDKAPPTLTTLSSRLPAVNALVRELEGFAEQPPPGHGLGALDLERASGGDEAERAALATDLVALRSQLLVSQA